MATEDNSNFFEGVEKLLEIWFEKSTISDGNGDARTISREKWEAILDVVQCKILDVIFYGGQTAFLLSESSMFVAKKRIILKTCGTTLCLQALPEIIALVNQDCGLDIVADMFYSRKNFMKPNSQPYVYQSFKNEVMYLDNIFSVPSVKQSASYCLGRMNGDCWFLYTLDHPLNSSLIGVNQPDQTLEILMTNLDVEVMKQFYLADKHGNIRGADEVTKESGICDIIPDSKLSTYLFDPCGYSLNGLLENGQYWTIHITPEEEFSYVSFETNLHLKEFGSLINKVIKAFKPGKFSMTLCVNEGCHVDLMSWNDARKPNVKGFKRVDKQISHLQSYGIYYTNYEKL